MKVFAKIFCVLSLSVSAAVPAHAQFFMAGDDPGRTKWVKTETEHFRIVYPVGLDSMARVYGRNLEYYRNPVGQSIHYLPGEYTRGKMPVLLHPFTTYSNGSVAWAPHRMDLYTQPEAYDAIALSWESMLAIHESRHVAQMQFGLSNALRPFGWFFGEMVNGAASGVYGHTSFFEGDAVCAETGLSPSGRGRTASFLNYYRIAFDNEDYRSLYKWSHESQTRFVPDKYALGYLLLGGIRYVYDTPDYLGQFLEHASKRPYDLTYTTVTKKITGKNLDKTFAVVRDTMTTIWKAEMDSRRPYTPMELVTEAKRGYLRYSDLAVEGDHIIAKRRSLYKTPEFVRIEEDGKVRRLRSASSYSGPMVADSGRIWWSETVGKGRWSLSNSSVVRHSDGKHKVAKTFLKRVNHYNPTISPYGDSVAVISYPTEGGCQVEIYDDFECLQNVHVLPDGLQMTEMVWTEDGIAGACVTDNGYGIYRLGNDGSWEAALGPEPASITSLCTDGAGRLVFTSDRTGAEEMYSCNIDGSDLRQETSTRYGAKGFRYSEDRQWVYCVAPRLDGEFVFRISADDLLHRPADFCELHHYTIADKLAEQESAYSYPVVNRDSVTFTDPVRYRKIAHLFGVHSWAPVYFNTNNIMDMSYDHYYDLASLGAAAVSQNLLGTMTAGFGYSAHKDPVDKSKWRHSLHANFKYTGRLPVIEASVDFNDRAAYNYGPVQVHLENVKTSEGSARSGTCSMPTYRTDRMSLRAWTAVSLPLYWNRTGVYFGIIPKVSYNITNDRFDTGTITWSSSTEEFLKDGTFRKISGHRVGKSFPNQYAIASLRGYVMRGTATGGVYPRLGLGGEVGIVEHFGLRAEQPVNMNFYNPTVYGYVYGYLPGILQEQGLRLTARYQQALDNEGLFWNGAVGVTPRGMARSEVGQLIGSMSHSAAFTADYAIPIPMGDLSIGRGFIDFKRLVLTPHFDGCLCPKGTLFSTGASLSADLGGVLWHTLYVSAGITFSYNGGSAYSYFEQSGTPIGRTFVGPLFSLDF